MRADERVLVDYTSAGGPVVTHVRGIMLANAIANLRRIGAYDEYASHIAAADLDVVLSTVAASWVPVVHVVAHYVACDALGLSRAAFDGIGASNADRVASTFLAGFLRRARGFGVDGMHISLTHWPKLNERLFKGGRCVIIELGPKEVHIERHGLPFAHCRAYREGFMAFSQSLASLFCKVAYLKPVRPRVPDAQNLAITLSWV
jgi:hypothetical protein